MGNGKWARMGVGDCGRDDVVGWAGEIGREWRQEEKMVMGESWMVHASFL